MTTALQAPAHLELQENILTSAQTRYIVQEEDLLAFLQAKYPAVTDFGLCVRLSSSSFSLLWIWQADAFDW